MSYEYGISKMLLNIYRKEEIAKYIRLSLSDEDNNKQIRTDESESIINQRRLINDFIDHNGNVGFECREYIDDGCSGTNFDRPGWQSLQEEMEAGKIKVVITKNLSRLGRSNFECSYYLDYYFPENNIRYIAIQEQIDTGNRENTNNEYAALNNFINEKYSRDLSKNIKRVFKMKQQIGEYMGSIPILGYKKDPNDKHRLIIDEDSAWIIKRIFDLYVKLESQSGVLKKLNKEKIPIPEVYKKTRRGAKVLNPYEWNYNTVRGILRNQMYIGNMVQNVHVKKSFRDKKIIKNNKDEWIIVEGTHEPIIDKFIYDKVQKLLDVNYRQPTPEHRRTLKGLMYCYECGHKIGIGNSKRNNKKIEKSYSYTYCNNYRKNSVFKKCSPHTINYNKLEEKILLIISNICNKYYRIIHYDELINEAKKKIITNRTKLEEKIKKKEIDVRSIDLKIEKIYIDRLNDVITSDMYSKLSSYYEEQKAIKQKEIIELNKKSEKYKANNSIDKLLNNKVIIKDYLINRKIMTRELILKIIDRIDIHQDKKIDLHLKVKTQ